MNNNLLIKYEDLRKIEYNQQIDMKLLNFNESVCDKIKMTKIISNSISQNFKIEMPKGCIWKTHFHDCIENIVMYKGILLNNMNNQQIDRLKPLIIDPYVDHSIEALEDSIFYIEFKQPQI